MRGNVYTLDICGRFRADPHPHVVAIDLSEHECLIVPSFSVGGAEVEDLILTQKNRFSTPDEAIRVELDNSNCVTWRGEFGRTGGRSYWLPCRIKRYSKADLPHTAPGIMCPECLVDIVAGVAAYRDHSPQLFSRETCGAIDATLADLRA